MPVVTVNGVEFYYETHGTGPAILGIHGTPSSAVLWEDAAPRLGQLGRCITYDRRGFHRSTAPEPFVTSDLDDQVEDAAGLLRALGVAPAVVVGRSTGGLVALALAMAHPDAVTALVLLEPAVPWLHPEARAWADRLRQVVLDCPPERVAETVIRDALGDELWESLPADLQALFAATSPAVLAETRGRGLDLSDEPFALGPDELAAVATPTLLVTAEDSIDALRLVNEELRRLLPAAESVTVAGGHLIDPAGPEVHEFVDRHLRPVGP
jgi:pimeloyl-ACP methyl ester carboxylesterase